MAFKFLDNGTYVTYLLNMSLALSEYTWEITDNEKLKYKDFLGDDMCVSEIVIEFRNGQEILYLETTDEVIFLFKRDKDKFMKSIPDITDLVDGK